MQSEIAGSMWSDEDVNFMRRALALADAQLGQTAPNPAVGCVLARDGVVLGEGATGDGGRPHAEEIALEVAGGRARGALAYVTLEPCAQRSSGAPSCSERLCAADLAGVVIAVGDPHPKAGGAGAARLRAAGLDVREGLLADHARALNAGFFSVVERGVPLLELSDDVARYDYAFSGPPPSGLGDVLRALAAEGVTRACAPLDGPLAREWRAALANGA